MFLASLRQIVKHWIFFAYSSMPREDQPVVRSSIEAKRIWLRNYESSDAPEVDENFHPKTPSPVQRSESSSFPPKTYMLPLCTTAE